ncbi:MULTISPECIES: hypothetical protein [unclassified Shewanella]|uniref:hypothetical protein n=1 Tax=unclassified Shewanella TaxID=196818 RepID=UPI0005A054C4|nr:MULTISPECIES: hypothetical protein [unclassified Shewanella]KIO36080.1 hypothetical protein DB48_12860 [Shewanella sp. cp20]MCG9723508.1 hypothetical protein [Shewanella sp. Isolate7]
MESLDKLNEDIIQVMQRLEQIPAEQEDADELVSNLLDLVGQRQLLLDKVLASPKEEDRALLQSQLELTSSFTTQAVNLLKHRQELLHVGRKSQRQLNVYKSIDAER